MPVVNKQAKKAVRRKKGNGVLDRIQPVKLSGTGMKMNVYGRSGTGKTTFACTFPKPLLLIGAEDGTRSVHNIKGVDFVQLEASNELVEIIDMLKGSKYKTVVMDAASSLQDLVLKEILGLDELPAQKSWGMASRDQYGQCALQVKEYLRALLDLYTNPMDIVIIAQERAFNNDDDNSDSLIMPYVGSALTPSVTGWLNPACDYITQTFCRIKEVTKTVKIAGKEKQIKDKTGGVEYCLRIGADPVYTTKFRSPKKQETPSVIVDPSYADLARLVKGV